MIVVFATNLDYIVYILKLSARRVINLLFLNIVGNVEEMLVNQIIRYASTTIDTVTQYG